MSMSHSLLPIYNSMTEVHIHTGFRGFDRNYPKVGEIEDETLYEISHY